MHGGGRETRGGMVAMVVLMYALVNPWNVIQSV